MVEDLIRVLLKNGMEKEFPIPGIGHNERFFQFLKQDELAKMQTLEASLEEVFIKVTGQALKG